MDLRKASVAELVSAINDGRLGSFGDISFAFGTLAGALRPYMADQAPRPQIETQVWEPDAERPGYLKLVRTKTVREVFVELSAILGEFPEGGEEYFTITVLQDEDVEWPEGNIVCFSVNGSSEGDYSHVEVHHGEKRQLLFLGKTFAGRDASWAFARRLADILEWH